MPAPLAQPTRCTRFPAILNDSEAVFGRVSVVQMARDNSANERVEGRRFCTMPGSARRIFSMASCTPMTPVEQTKTSLGWQCRRRAVSSTVRTEAAYPCSPVAQLALPAFTITARMRPFDARRFALETVTGAAMTRFFVKTAAAEAGTSLESIARSSAPVFFKPHAVAKSGIRAVRRLQRGRASWNAGPQSGGEAHGRDLRSSARRIAVCRGKMLEVRLMI